MADTGEDRELRARIEANETERFRESQRFASKIKEAIRRGRKLKPVDDPKLIPPGVILKPPKESK
jgi:hypothetical protein